jgi:cytochrome c oxidase subunit 2
LVTPPTTEQWWSLFYYFSILGTIIGAIVISFLVTAALKYRYTSGKQDPKDAPKPGTFPKDRGHLKYLFMLSFITLTIISTLVIGSFGAFHLLTTPPDKGLDIEVTGFQWAWGFKYPNGVQTVSQLVIPVNQTIVFHVTSSDVKHKFGIPYFKTSTDAIPGQVGEIWIKATSTGDYDIRCYELCGVGHANMVGTISAVSQSEFNQWLENATKK